VKVGEKTPELRGDELIVYTVAKMEHGQANIDVLKQVAKYFRVEQGSVRIVSGLSSRKKLLEIREEQDLR
jgi:uncharacterized protein YggU (UPF0235/DUF167 family)